MKIIVTGGAGFIGSNVVDAYIEAGHEVLVMDDLSTGKRENLNPKAKFHEVDIRIKEAADIIKSEAPDVINHHAAQMSVPASVEDPKNDADINILGFLNILEAAKELKKTKIIFISSGGAIYGEAEEYPTSEAYPPQPLSPYAVTKYASEKYLAYYKHLYGLDYTVLRYSNVYGPRQIPHGEAGVVAIFMDNLLAKLPSVIYSYPDKPEGMLRDYLFVGDVARANLLALEKGSGEAFNIGTGEATSTRALYYQICKSLDKKIGTIEESLLEPPDAGVREGDIRRSCLDVSSACEGLGWKPEVDLKLGIDKTVDWRVKG
jgi:UDP-glucose 4-epimerase